MKLNRKWLLIASLVLSVAMATGGTLAYLTDTESDVNVMTIGNVDIDQHEYQRAKGVTYNATAVEGSLVPFVDGQPLLPAVPKNDLSTDYTAEPNDLFYWGPYVTAEGAGNGLWNDDNISNVVDKMVFVENTGKSDAYYRTLIAFECPDGMEYDQGREKQFMMNVNLNDRFVWTEHGYHTVNGTRYLVMAATYTPILKPNEISRPSLLQVLMTQYCTNDDMEKLGDSYDILVVSQAVQAAGFDDAATALEAGFGRVTPENVQEWFKSLAVPEIFNWEGVNYIDDGKTVTVTSADETGTTVYRGILSDGKTTATNVKIGEGITRLNNRALCKAPTLTTVELPDSLTYIDESVFQESNFTSIEIPENVTYIGKAAMGYCDNLEKIIIRAKNVEIANYVARSCPKLKEVYIYSDNVTFESGSMYFTKADSGDASGITFYVESQEMADTLNAAFSTSSSYGQQIKSLDGKTTYYPTTTP